jgi:hypothetical protein
MVHVSYGTLIAPGEDMREPAFFGVGIVSLVALIAVNAGAAPKKKAKPKKPVATETAPSASSSEPTPVPTAPTAPTTTAAAPSAPAAPLPQPATGEEEFSREAAIATITAVDLQKCRATNAEKGEGHVTITFQSNGSAAKAVVDKGPWIGTPVAKCMAAQFKKQVKVPAFKADGTVTVGKTFKFE